MKLNRRGLAPIAALLAAAAAATLSLLAGPAKADAGAAAVIQGWSRSMTAGSYKQLIVTGTQGGSQGGGPVALLGEGVLTRRADGALVSGRIKLVFSDRRASIAGRPIQPFDAARADLAELTLTPAGNLVVHSVTWNSTETVSLQTIGNQMLSGWGSSIGNQTAPNRWTIGVSPQNYQIPG
jgi:hypothetical protein